jgi:indolepyruvate ferredoxin oxidoreductase, alpha subunit
VVQNPKLHERLWARWQSLATRWLQPA